MTTKDEVLAALKSADGYISGESISTELGISRAAVNGAVKSLRADGYEIESSTNKGYLLTSSPDIISAGELAQFMSRERLASVIILNKVDSTNLYLKRAVSDEQLPVGTVVAVDSQTAGRGRLGRSFESPAGRGIFMSYLIDPGQATPAELSEITAWTAVAVAWAVGDVCGVCPMIKWVNDLVLGSKKICGILTELSVEGESGAIQSVVAGIGVNVNHERGDFTEAVADIATSVFIETGRRVNCAELTAAMISRLDEMVAAFPREREKYLKAYRNNCAVIGKRVAVIRAGRGENGKAVGISDDFGLNVRFDDGHTETLKNGEVSIRGLYGYV